jgi:hypothetical protein
MRWRNRGTYGWMFSRLKPSVHPIDDEIWIFVDYLDTEEGSNINMIIGATNSWTESWNKIYAKFDEN